MLEIALSFLVKLAERLIPILIEKLEPLIIRLIPVVVMSVIRLLERRSSDPEFAKQLDAAFDAHASAKTKEERLNASENLQKTVSSS